MQKSTVAAWVFAGLLAVIAVANIPPVADRINTLLGRHATTMEATAIGEPEAGSADVSGQEVPADAKTDRPGESEQASGEEADAAAVTADEGQETGQAAEPETEVAALPADEEQATAEASVTVPRFGLLRVEPDGSTVIAGQAAPNADIEILSGSETIATAKAAGNGDFAAILDTPLKPGDYEIVLRAIEESGESAMSLETAIVSVPEKGQEGELLALVEEPGAPSRLINTPEPKLPASDVAEAQEATLPAAESEEEAVAEGVMDEPAATGEEPMEAEPEMTAAPSGDEPVSSETAAEMAAAEEPATDAEPAEPGEEPGIVDSGGEASPAEGTEMATAEDAASDTETADEQTEVAMASPDAESEPQPEEPSGQPQVRIEAVEIDGGTVFVAGAAPPGAQIRVYANDILLGDTNASPGGRFLVQANRDLPVGDYIMRADMIESATADVIARAAVPFARSEGERLAAVAVEESPSATETPPDAETTEDAAADAETAPTAGATETGEPESTEMQADVAAAPEAEAPGTDAPRAGEMAETGESAQRAPTPTEQAVEEEEVAVAPPEAAAEVAGSPPAIEEETPVTTTRLQTTNSSVIIRRGDTLWQISRRVYGRGIRYTTIYLANETQIADPDRIWPGQVFALPEKALPASDEEAAIDN
jgi:nucleoid-associated protein YgaU